MKNGANFLRETIDLVKQIETRFLELGARLFNIRDKQLWSETYDSYEDFLDTAHISHSNASILASIHRHYVVEGKIPQTKLAGIGYSNLYEAIPLIEKEGIKSAMAKAETLTRAEIKDEVRDKKHGVHHHVLGNERWAACEKCGKFVKIQK